MRKITLLFKVAVSALTVLLGAVPVQAAVSDPHTSYVGNNWESSVIVPSVKAQWTLPVDRADDDWEMGKGVVATGAGKAFVIRGGQLVAVNVQTGKQAWKFGAKLTAPLLYREGRVYVSSAAGILYSLNASTGKKIWTSSAPSPKVRELYADGDQLFAVNGDIAAYSLKDGKYLWRENYTGMLDGPLLFAGEMLLTENEESGAYTYTILRAFDRKTGKEAWNLSNHSLPVSVQGGIVLTQRTATLLDLVPLTTVDSVDLKTGKVVKTIQFNPENIDISQDETLRSGGKVWVSGDRIYINEGTKVYGYPVDTDPAKEFRDSYMPQGTGSQVRYAAGPHDGRLLYTDGYGIYGVKLANKATVFYNGGLTSQIARFDLIGHGMYIAQTDGTLVAMNLITAVPAFKLQTGGRVFGPSLPESGMILVQTKGKVLAFKEPQSLKVK